MNKRFIFTILAGAGCLTLVSCPAQTGDQQKDFVREKAALPADAVQIAQNKELPGSAKSAAQLEKEKALSNPYPNDFGPDSADVTGYSADAQAGYKLMQIKCARCHTPSRPLNSQFVDVKPDELASLKKSNPAMFKDNHVWQIEDGIWQRYVKRMMAKPGCEIASADGKKIFLFLVEYSKKNKLGKSSENWEKNRRKLLADFKAKYPARYKELFESK